MRFRPPLRFATRTISPSIDGGEEAPAAKLAPFLSPTFVGDRCGAKRGGVGAPYNWERGSTSFGPVDKNMGPAENNERNSKTKQRLITLAAMKRAGFCSQGSWWARERDHFACVDQVNNRIHRFELSSPNHHQVSWIEAYRRVRSRVERTDGYALIHGFGAGGWKRFQEEAPQTSAVGVAAPPPGILPCKQQGQSHDVSTPSPPRFTRHLSPSKPGERNPSWFGVGLAATVPRPHEMGESWRAKRAGEGGRIKVRHMRSTCHKSGAC
jgi:hypothetical protein